jgi:hypothetical protein
MRSSSSFLKPTLMVLMLLILLIVTPSVDAIFGKLAKKKKQAEEKQFTAQESAGLGMEAFGDLCT